MNTHDQRSYTHQDLQKVAADARMPYARTHEANLAKLAQLIEDADAKATEHSQESGLLGDYRDAHYWCGVRDGLRRAVNVLEGRG